MANGIGSVWAANFGEDGKPNGVGSVWIENASAFTASGGGNPEVESYVTANSGKIDNVCSTVQTNSAQWAQGGSDFDPTYMSAQIDKKLDTTAFSAASGQFARWFQVEELNDEVNKKLDKSEIAFGKYNGVDYVSAISGKTISAKYAATAQTANTANKAYTATFDDQGNYLAQTHNDLTALNEFVKTNSANWEGGSSPAGEGVLFHFYNSYDPNYGSQTQNSFVSGATELYFEASIDSQQGTPSDVVITRQGSEIGRAYWSQVSSDGSYNYYTASYNNADGGEIGLQNNGYDYTCYVSANGTKTYAFKQGSYDCSTDKTVKFNIQGYNFQGQIEGWLQGGYTPITSFTGGLTDFTAKGYERYVTNINYEDGNNSYYYDLSADFSDGGSTVTSGDVFPPTNNLDPYATYYLGWNASNGGLQWFYQGSNGGN